MSRLPRGKRVSSFDSDRETGREVSNANLTKQSRSMRFTRLRLLLALRNAPYRDLRAVASFLSASEPLTTQVRQMRSPAGEM